MKYWFKYLRVLLHVNAQIFRDPMGFLMGYHRVRRESRWIVVDGKPKLCWRRVYCECGFKE